MSLRTFPDEKKLKATVGSPVAMRPRQRTGPNK